MSMGTGAARAFDWVFFDVGETLMMAPPPVAAWAELLGRHGCRLSPEGVSALVDRARLEALTADHVGPAPHYRVDLSLAAARWRRFQAAVVDGAQVPTSQVELCSAELWSAYTAPTWFPLYLDAPPVLEALVDSGYRLGIISNWESRLEQLCGNHGLDRFFTFVLASEAAGWAKPSPLLFRLALKRAGVAPRRAVHVGDSLEHDIHPAAELGISAVLLDRRQYYPPGSWQPTITSLEALPELLAAGDRPLGR